MSNLDRRIKKLEAGQPRDENIVNVHAPLDWTDEQCQAKAEELIGDRFNGEEFKLSVSRAHNIDEFRVVYAMTGNELTQLMERIRKNPRRIGVDVPYQETKGDN